MFKFFSKQRHLLSYLILSVLWLAIVVTNYTPGTWLIGWDSLLPELDFGINISRTLTPVWQESQGFGLLGGIGHASEITRQLILWLFSWTMPTSALRYFWTLSMVLVGSIGAYHLILTVIKYHFNFTKDARLPALIGALFYIFNPATVQNFYAPLEAFSSFYGFLPWIMLFIVEYFYTYSTKSLLKLFALLIFASSAFHVQTMFIVLCMVISIFAAEVAIKKKQRSLFVLVHLAIVVAAATAFWFLPVGYFAASSADATILSKQNQLATSESYLLNQSFGDFFNTITHRGYWLEYTDVIHGQTSYMFESLREHLYNPLITLIQIVLALVAIAGIIITTFQKKSVLRWSYLGVVILCWGMLSAGSGIFGLIFKAITEGLPLFYQMFRVTFTKWSVVYALFASIGIGVFIYYLKDLSIKIRHSITALPIAILIAVFSILTVLPIFRGQFFYDQVQLQIPNAYFSLFDYFKQQPEQSRIMMLPAHSFWDWRFHDWGYRGSGFIWYGIKQPIIDRNFDVWSRTNETFYTQLSKAILDEDGFALASLLRQYDVSYIVIDESVELPAQSKEGLRIDVAKDMLSSLQIKEVWSQDFLHVFAVPNNQNFLSAPESYVSAEGDTTMLVENPVFKNQGNYVSANSLLDSSIIYPFASLTRLTQEDIDIINDTVRYTYQFPESGSYTLTLPALTQGKEYSLPVTVEYNDGQLVLDFLPLVTLESGLQKSTLESLGTQTFSVSESYDRVAVNINNQLFILEKDKPRTIFLQLPAASSASIIIGNADETNFADGRFSFTTDTFQRESIPASTWQHLLQKTEIAVNGTHKNIEVIVPTVENSINLDDTVPQQTQKCDVLNRGTSQVVKEYGTLLSKADNRGAICHGWELDQASTNDFHLLEIKGENKKGRPLKVFIEHLGKNKIVQEFLTPENEYDVIYSLPSWNDTQPSTYALNVETRSLGGEQTENLITSISQYQLPLTSDWLTDISLVKDGAEYTYKTEAKISSKAKIGTYSYMVTVETEQNGLLVLEQAFDKGWVAFSNNDFLQHVEYNGWANGWLLPEGNYKITLFYLPQLLHFVGLGLLVATLLYFINNKKTIHATLEDLKHQHFKSPQEIVEEIIRHLRSRLTGKN